MIALTVFWAAFNAVLCACFDVLGTVLGVAFAAAFVCFLIVSFLYLIGAALGADSAAV